MSVKMSSSSEDLLPAVPHSHSFKSSHHKIRDGATRFFRETTHFCSRWKPAFHRHFLNSRVRRHPPVRVLAQTNFCRFTGYWVFENSDAALRKAISCDLASLLDHALAPERVGLCAHEHYLAATQSFAPVHRDVSTPTTCERLPPVGARSSTFHFLEASE